MPARDGRVFRAGLWLAFALALPAACRAGSPAPAPAPTPDAGCPPPAREPGGNFVLAESIDYAKVLPPPPAPDSLAARADLEAVLQVQAWRTPEQERWAKEVELDVAFDNRPILGEWFTAETLPACDRLFRRVKGDMYEVQALAKKQFSRLRPPQVDPRVRACVTLPVSSSYPSGHSVHFFVTGEVLAGLFPAHRAAIMDRAHRAAWSRILCGVHFPSDIIGGQILAGALVERFRQNPAFLEAEKQCRIEAAAVARVRAAD